MAKNVAFKVAALDQLGSFDVDEEDTWEISSQDECAINSLFDHF